MESLLQFLRLGVEPLAREQSVEPKPALLDLSAFSDAPDGSEAIDEAQVRSLLAARQPPQPPATVPQTTALQPASEQPQSQSPAEALQLRARAKALREQRSLARLTRTATDEESISAELSRLLAAHSRLLPQEVILDFGIGEPHNDFSEPLPPCWQEELNEVRLYQQITSEDDLPLPEEHSDQ